MKSARHTLSLYLASPLRVAIPYLLLSVVWIFFSDKVLAALVTNAAELSRIQTYKGISFVLITAAFLYHLARKNIRAVEKIYKEKLDQEHVYRAIFENSSDMIVVTDEHDQIKYLSNNVERILGYTMEEFIGMPAYSLLHPEDIPKLTALAHEVPSKRKHFSLILRVRHKEGHYLWMESNNVYKTDDPAIRGVISNSRDVTDRILAAQKTRESELLFRSAFEQSVVGMAIVNMDGQRVLVNDKLCELTGYSREELATLPTDAMIHPDDREANTNNKLAIVQGATNGFNMEVRIVRKDGSIIWVDQTGSVMKDEYGENAYFVGVLKDMSERMEAQQKISDSELQFRSAFEQSVVGMAITNIQGRRVLVNSKMCALTGYTQEEMAELPTDALVFYADREMNNRHKAAIMDGIIDGFNLELRIVRKDGRVIWVDQTGSVVKDDFGRNAYFVGVSKDITDRMQAEERMRESELLFRSAFEQSVVGMTVANIKGQRVMVNDKMCVLTGYTAEELKQMPIDALLYEPDRELNMMHRTMMLNGESEGSHMECRLVKKDGTIIWVDKTANLIKNEDGNVVYVVVVTKDITDRKHAETELNLRNKELDTFIYRSSHDLRGPIATLLGLVEIARTDEHMGDEKVQEYIGYFGEISQKLEQVLGNLMAVTHIKQNRIIMKPVRPLELVNTILRRNMGKSITTTENVVVNIDDDLVLNADESLLNIILSSIIENALTFKNADAHQHHVVISITQKNNLTSLCVSDNGAGIAAEDQQKVFDLFYHGKNKERGSGIGLYLAKSAIDRLDDAINIISRVHEGTEVTVTIPIRHVEARPIPTIYY